MKLQGFIFDLDGTLLYTLEDIAAAENAALAEYGLPPKPVDEYRWIVGGGAEDIARRLLPPGLQTEQYALDFVRKFRAYYHLNWHEKTRLYPGLADLLNHLLERNSPLAVLSNKPEEFTLKIVEHFFGHWPDTDRKHIFSHVIGQRQGQPVKPDPAQALSIAHDWNLPPEAIGMIGDSDIDILTAKNAGMAAIGAGWGFRGREELASAGAQLVLTQPLDLIRYLD